MLVAKYKTQFVFKITASCLLLILAVFLFVPFDAVHAGSEIVENLDTVAAETGLEAVPVRVIIARLIKIALGFVGTIALIIVIYAGYSYMTSGGDPAKVDKAKKWLTNGAIGLVIIFSAYAITSFLINALTGGDNVGGDYDIASIKPKGLGYGLSGNAFGEILSGTFPTPEQQGVPRNTMILASFKLPVKAESLIDLDGDYSSCPSSLAQCTSGSCPEEESVCGPVDVAKFKLFRCDAMPTWPAGQAPNNCFNAEIGLPDDSVAIDGYIILTADRKTVIFNPNGDSADHLGSADEDVSYIVNLAGGTTGIKKLEPVGESIFGADGYKWRFTTSTLIDSTPPKIVSVIPKDQAGIDAGVSDITLDKDGNVKRNTIITVNFNEPVLPPLSPIQTTTCVDGYHNNEAQVLINGEPKLADCDTGHVPGEWTVGINQYKTIQFLPSAECEGVDINSCGEPVFCLPANRDLSGKVLAALMEGGISMVGTGIMDLASNSLDGNDDDEASGTAADNYDWSFGVGNTVDLVPPAIVELLPRNAAANIDAFVPIKAIFNKPMEAASVDANIYLYGEDFDGWFDPNRENTIPYNSVQMTHGPFNTPSQESGAAGPLYMPVVKSKVRDLFQNCFTPSRSVLGNTYDEEGEIVDVDQELTTITDTTCKDLGVAEYGKSCCPSDDGIYNLNKQDQDDPEDLNECEPVGNITR